MITTYFTILIDSTIIIRLRPKLLHILIYVILAMSLYEKRTYLSITILPLATVLKPNVPLSIYNIALSLAKTPSYILDI